jgi:hypothetical protein
MSSGYFCRGSSRKSASPLDGLPQLQLGPHYRPEDVYAANLVSDLDVIVEGRVRKDVAQDSFPHVSMSIDEARHDDGSAGIDNFRIGGAKVRPDRSDLASGNQHVGALEVANCRIERQHAAILDQDRPTRCRCRAGPCLSPRRSACHQRRNCGRSRDPRPQEPAPRQRVRRSASTAKIASDDRHRPHPLPESADREEHSST